jgi:hypothetical protein
MFKNTFHETGFLSIYYSLGSKPLELWHVHPGPDSGVIHEVVDSEIRSKSLELTSSNISTCYAICPALKDRTLGIRLPFFNMLVKNLQSYFSYELEVLDDKGTVRRFRASNFQNTTRCIDEICVMPLRLEDGWNFIQMNLTELTRTAYGTKFVEVLRVMIHANCRLRLVFFSDNLYSQEQLPPELKIFIPKQQT